ncbi:LysR family transcriptional regulator [Bosea beijingensis]
MLLRHLYYFVTLAQEKHYARAAKVCNVAQPTMSAAVHKLEEEFKVCLVVRGQRYVGLTADGENVLQWGRRILADYDGLLQCLGSGGSGLTGRLRIGAIPTALPVTPLLTTPFCDEHPSVRIDTVSMPSREIISGLGAFSIDAGLTYLDDEIPQTVRAFELYRERYQLLVPKGHRLAGEHSVSWEEAAGERLCLLNTDMQNRRVIDSIAAAAGVEIDAKVVSNSFVGLCSHVAHGGWASIVPQAFSSLTGNSRDLVFLDIGNPSEDRPIALVVQDRTPQSPIASALIALAKSTDMATRLSQAHR